MGKKLWVFSLIGLLLCLPLFAQNENWLTDFEEAKKKAQESDQNLLVIFTATWCELCKKMQNEVFSQTEFTRFATDNFVLVKIDADRNRELVDKLNVEGFPTTFFTDKDGKKLGEIIGIEPLSEFMKTAKKFVKKPSSE